MVSRRDVLVGGGGLAMLGLGLPAIPARGAGIGGRPALFVYDRLVPDIEAAVQIVQREAVAVAAMTGDIGTAWMAHLEPMWREQPHAVAGVTFGGALFCLQELGRAYGLACTFHTAPATREELSPAIFAALRTSGNALGDTLPGAATAANRPVVWLMQQAQPAAGHVGTRNAATA